MATLSITQTTGHNQEIWLCCWTQIFVSRHLLECPAGGPCTTIGQLYLSAEGQGHFWFETSSVRDFWCERLPVWETSGVWHFRCVVLPVWETGSVTLPAWTCWSEERVQHDLPSDGSRVQCGSKFQCVLSSWYQTPKRILRQMRGNQKRIRCENFPTFNALGVNVSNPAAHSVGTCVQRFSHWWRAVVLLTSASKFCIEPKNDRASHGVKSPFCLS